MLCLNYLNMLDKKERRRFEFLPPCNFFDTAPSFEAWETHRYLKNRLGIVRARGGGLLDHPCAALHLQYQLQMKSKGFVKQD